MPEATSERSDRAVKWAVGAQNWSIDSTNSVTVMGTQTSGTTYHGVTVNTWKGGRRVYRVSDGGQCERERSGCVLTSSHG